MSSYPKYWPTAKTRALLHENPGRPRDVSAPEPPEHAAAPEPTAQGRGDQPEGGQDQLCTQCDGAGWNAVVCDLCAGSGWASYPDPFFDGALIDARCPACHTASRRRPVPTPALELDARVLER